mmetsp:Transcript_110986/g.220747  ORF Transcript_110986/g.220747 Transcript_110986/m.220747 type:complete len:387 (-) Transcript_110986:40-1200(-)
MMAEEECLQEEMVPIAAPVAEAGACNHYAPTSSFGQRWWDRARSRHQLVAGLAGICFVSVVLMMGSQWHEATKHNKGNPGDVLGLAADDAWRSRRGSFLVIGDWGWDSRVHGNVYSNSCQRAIAEAMGQRMALLGDVQFVVNLGDSFYPGGVVSKTDPQWDEKWRNIYSKELRSVPWYSVYGNHDYWFDLCACGGPLEECALINANKSNMDLFYMPNYTWSLERPDLGLEVIALDLNRFSEAFDKAKQPEPVDCMRTRCNSQCRATLNMRTEESLKLFYERKAASTQPNLLVFSHYPTDYLWPVPQFISALKDGSKHHIEYFGGHRHNVDQTTTIPIFPNNNWVVGGGGGFGCDGPNQGFVVGEVDKDYKITTYPVLVSREACCSN